MTWQASGPFDTEQDAAAAATWRHVDTDPYDNEAWRQARAEAKDLRLHEALHRTGVPVWAYDTRILAWFAGWEPSMVEVVASLIERAYEAGLRDARTDRPPYAEDDQ